MLTHIKLHLNQFSIPGEILEARCNWCQGPADEKRCCREKISPKYRTLMPLCGLSERVCSPCGAGSEWFPASRQVSLKHNFPECPIFLRYRKPRGLRRSSEAGHLVGFRIRFPPGYGCLSLVSVVCPTGWSRVDGRPTESLRDIEC